MQLQRFDDARLGELMNWFPDAHACRVWGGMQFRFPFTPATFREDAKIDSLRRGCWSRLARWSRSDSTTCGSAGVTSAGCRDAGPA